MPIILNSPKAFRWPMSNSVFEEPTEEKLGVDFEWNNSNQITIVGIANRRGFESGYLGMGIHEGFYRHWSACEEVIGHNIIQADIPMLLKQVNHDLCPFPILPRKKFDTMIYFYLCHPHLCRARQERPDDDEDERGGGGFMNIWTMASLYSDIPNWKECRGTTSGCGPCPTHDPLLYNGLDAWVPYICRDKLERDARIKKVDHLYPVLEKASWIAAQMSEHGITVDLDAIQKLEQKHSDDTEKIRGELPQELFGKEGGISPKKCVEYFRKKYGLAPESSSEEDLRSFYEDYGHEEAGKLIEYKEAGKGLKAWFDKRFIDKEDLLHPSFRPAGATSTGRWASSHPNFQNIPVRRALDIRRVIMARPGMVLYKADYKQAEARCILHLSGYKSPEDLKSWLKATIGLSEDNPGVKALGGIWNAIKSFMHAGHYGEGLTLLSREELKSTYYQRAIAAGALEVYDDWTFHGKIVAFSGVNLASRMFGRAGFSDRAAALGLQAAYFKRFPAVRKWQQSVAGLVERDGQVRSPSGHLLEVYGRPKDALKTAWAMMGSNPVAFATSLAVARAFDDGTLPLAQIHDEILYEFEDSIPECKVIDKIRSYQEFEHESMPGLILPVEISKGKNWGEMTKVYG